MRFKTCEVCGAKGGRRDNNKRIFMAKFPSDEERCRQWVKVVGKEDLAYIPIEKLATLKHVCGQHFKTSDFKKKKTQLKKTAVPSLQLTAEPLSDHLLINFPLHVAEDKKPSDRKASSKSDHNYCKTSVPGEKRLHSPETSTSAQWRDGESYQNIPKKIRTQTDTSEIMPSTSDFVPEVEPYVSTETTLISTSKINKKDKSTESDTSEIMPSTSHFIPEVEPYVSTETNLTSNSKINKKDEPSESLLITPRKRKLLKKIKTFKIKNKILMQKVKTIEKLESPVLQSLVESSLKNQDRKGHGKRWTKLNKSVALAIYKKSPKAYRYLSQLLPMPSIRTLQIVLENMNMEPGINPLIMEHLKKKAEQSSDKEKCCAVLFDEMALKKRLIYNFSGDKIEGFEDLGDGARSMHIADHALVFMIQGIYKKLKQPISYYFVKGTISTKNLANLIEVMIIAVHAIGFKVVNTVCDQGPTNVGAINLLKEKNCIPSDQNYFLVNEEKVFIIYDVPHLFKSIRNNFLQAGEMMLNNQKAKWRHLVEVERKNQDMKLRFTKITKLHIAPKYRTKMRVKLAAQILSNTVAAILKLMSESTMDLAEKSSILQTAEVIKELDSLFDCTNGPANKKDFKKNIRTNVSKNSFHHKVWPEYKEKLKTLIFLKSESQLRLRNIRCVNGYITTLSSLESIWEIVESKGFKYLNLRQLNQDALENLFGIIRQHSPTNRNPTCHHFKGALKSAILTRLSAPLSKGSNCEKDENEIIFDFQEIVFTKKAQENVTQHDTCSYSAGSEYSAGGSEVLLHIPETQNTERQMEDLKKYFKNFELQPTVYVSGYIAYVILKKSKCESCKTSLAVSEPEENSIYNYITLREFWKEKQSLTYPTIKLCETIDLATKLFEKGVVQFLFRQNLCAYAKTLMMTTIDFTWCCEIHQSKIIDDITQNLCLLLIRNECRIRNKTFAVCEENVADTLKKAEQQGVAK